MADVPLHRQKTAVLRAHEILAEVYPARIGNKKATEDGARVHLEALDAVMETLDKLDTGGIGGTAKHGTS
jgi:hypothetical protein